LAAAGGKATDAAEQAGEKAAGGLHKAAGLLRDKGGEMGGDGVGQKAAMVADRLDSAARSLESGSGDDIVAGLESMVRSRPTQAMLVAAGLGFLLAKATR
jgi:hypothetical protein